MVRDYQSQSARKFTCALILIVSPWCVITKANQPESLPVHWFWSCLFGAWLPKPISQKVYLYTDFNRVSLVRDYQSRSYLRQYVHILNCLGRKGREIAANVKQRYFRHQDMFCPSYHSKHTNYAVYVQY